MFECHGTVLRTDGRALTYQISSRYQLKGNVRKGDVSLTIENVTLADSGTYCCRVQFPGPMNDKKLDLMLDIRPGEWTFACVFMNNHLQITLNILIVLTLSSPVTALVVGP